MRYKIIDQNGLNFVTFTVVDWLDIFVRKEYKDIVIESLKYCQEHKGLLLYAYVIMTSHIHLIVQTHQDHKLSDTIRDFKKFTGKTLVQVIKNNRRESRREWLLHRFEWNAKKRKGKDRKYQFWQSDNHPIALYSPRVIWQKINYIHLNPVVEGIVSKREHYIYSSAKNYMEEKDVLIDVRLMDLFNDSGYLHTGM